MFDEQQRLAESKNLTRLLSHYAQLGLEDRETWHDRVMSIESVTPRELTKLYGELVGHGWIEQNTGVTPRP